MKMALLIFNLALAMIGLGQVWLVQLSSYPLWAHVGTQEFREYHIAWWHSIWLPIFVPAGLAILCTIGLLWYRPHMVSRTSVWICIWLLIATYGLTWIWWAPLMALQGASPREAGDVFSWSPWLRYAGIDNLTRDQWFRLLLGTHWLRVGLVSAYALCLFGMTLHVMNYHPHEVRAGALGGSAI